MKKIKVEIEGITPLLMNSPKSMIDDYGSSGLKSKTTKYDTKKEAEKLAYRKSNGELYVSAEAIKGSIINASAYKKFGKYTAKPIVAGGIIVSPSEIGLGTKDYDIDIRTVVVQRARVVKARPKIEKWKLQFEISYNEELIASGDLIKPLLEEAGQRVGILDFRPQKTGSFGMFKVTKWKEE